MEICENIGDFVRNVAENIKEKNALSTVGESLHSLIDHQHGNVPDGIKKPNLYIGNRADMFSMDVHNRFKKSVHDQYSRKTRGKVLDEIVGKPTRIIAAIDNASKRASVMMRIVDGLCQTERENFIRRMPGKTPYENMERNWRREKLPEARARIIKERGLIDSGDDTTDRLVQVMDNGMVSVLNLNDGTVITEYPVSNREIDVIKDAIEYDVMADGAWENLPEKMRRANGPNSKQRKQIGDQMTELEKLRPLANKFDAMKFPENIMKNGKRYEGLPDFANLNWDVIYDDAMNAVVIPELVRVGLLKRKPDDQDGNGEISSGTLTDSGIRNDQASSSSDAP